MKWNTDSYNVRRQARTSSFCAAGLILMAAVVMSCDRPFVAPRLPEIRLLEPNRNAVFVRRSIVIRAAASSFREISHLESNGNRMHYDAEKDSWVDTLLLDPGINNVVITAYDVEQTAGRDTVQLTFLRPVPINDAPALPSPWRLGGHTATMLNDGSVLVAGGSSSVNGAAFKASFILPDGGEIFTEHDHEMVEARIGHSASLLPDGRVLILGGSTSGALTSVTQLVRSAEIYDPRTQRFSPLIVQGTPLQRMGHATFVSEGVSNYLIDVYGGAGRSSSQSNTLGVRRDFRTFVLRNDTLQSLSADGEFLSEIEAAGGVSSVQVNEPEAGTAGRFLVTGSNFLGNTRIDVNFTIDFSTTPVKIELLPGQGVPRTRHASVTLQPGLIALFGGVQHAPATTLGSTEVFLESAGRFFTLDNVLTIRRRYGHTATKLRSERILLLGGFDSDGQALSTSQYIDWKATP